MPFSKFDPYREVPPEDPLAASSPAAARRVWVLKWANRITFGMTLLGFILIAYWLVEGR